MSSSEQARKLLAEAAKKLAGIDKGWSNVFDTGKESKFEEISKLFEKAAKLFKDGALHSEAAAAFKQAAECMAKSKYNERQVHNLHYEAVKCLMLYNKIAGTDALKSLLLEIPVDDRRQAEWGKLLGDEYLEAGEIDKAIDAYNKSVSSAQEAKQYRQFISLLTVLMNMHVERGRYDLVSECASKLLTLDSIYLHDLKQPALSIIVLRHACEGDYIAARKEYAIRMKDMDVNVSDWIKSIIGAALAWDEDEFPRALRSAPIKHEILTKCLKIANRGFNNKLDNRDYT